MTTRKIDREMLTDAAIERDWIEHVLTVFDPLDKPTISNQYEDEFQERCFEATILDDIERNG